MLLDAEEQRSWRKPSGVKGASLEAQWWRSHLPEQETQIWSLGQEDLLEKGTAAHSNILAWEIPWTEEPGGLQSKGLQESDTK